MGRQPNLFPKLYVRDPSQEGQSVMYTGTVGSGKTALMVHTLRRLFEEKQRVARELRENGGNGGKDTWANQQIANEKVFWIGDEDGQWSRLPVRVADRLMFVEDGMDPRFFLDGKQFEVKSIPFVDFSDIMDYADIRKLNIVYIRDPMRVMDFIQYLIDESLGEWVSVAVDEVEDIAPAYSEADNFKRAQRFARRVARARKARVSFYATLQSDSQLDWRTPSIVPYRGLCQGAKRPKGWKIYKQVAGNVPVGKAHIATRSYFQRIKYPPYTMMEKMKVKGLKMWIDAQEDGDGAG